MSLLFGFSWSEIFAVIPQPLFFTLFFVLLALGLFLLKQLFFRHLQKVHPTDLRKARASDGHICWAGVELEVDHFLASRRIPHDKPERPELEKYYYNSIAVPNFVVFRTWKKQKIHSLIEIRDLDRPKKYPAPVITGETQAKFPRLTLTLHELMDPSWRTKGNQFYKELRKELKKWIAEEKQKVKVLKEQHSPNKSGFI